MVEAHEVVNTITHQDYRHLVPRLRTVCSCRGDCRGMNQVHRWLLRASWSLALNDCPYIRVVPLKSPGIKERLMFSLSRVSMTIRYKVITLSLLGAKKL